jgi:hypothetical protein
MARYRDAIVWMAVNDDNEWVTDGHGIPSVTACLTADLFGKTEEQVTADLKRELARRNKIDRSSVRASG